MLTRKSIDTVLLSVGAEKLSQREWDWMKMLKPMDPPPAMVTTSALLQIVGGDKLIIPFC